MDILQAIYSAFHSAAEQMTLYSAEGDQYTVNLSDPVGFTMYLGMAFVLYAIRETNTVPLRFMPIIAILLGVTYSVFVEFGELNQRSIIAGLRLALLGIGSVATVKYFLDKGDKQEIESKKWRE